MRVIRRLQNLKWGVISMHKIQKQGDIPPKNRKKVILRLWRYLYQYKLYLVGALLLTFGSNILSLIGPSLAGYAIDAFGTTKGQVHFDSVFFFISWMLILYFFSSIFAYLLAMLMISLSQKVVYKMRKDVFERLVDLPVGYFDRNQTGDIISRLTYDIDTINTSLSNDVIQIFTSVITVLGSLVMMLILSPVLVLVFCSYHSNFNRHHKIYDR